MTFNGRLEVGSPIVGACSMREHVGCTSHISTCRERRLTTPSCRLAREFRQSIRPAFDQGQPCRRLDRDSRYEGMTIDGIPVTAMIAAYKAAQAPGLTG
jgi:hypothetical protein